MTESHSGSGLLRYPGAMRRMLIFGIAALSFAQTDRVMDEARADYWSVRDYLIRSAEKMPARDYDFRPAPDVRTFAQQIAHVADDQYNLCAPVRGETRNARYRD
jgi:DinB superfamily